MPGSLPARWGAPLVRPGLITAAVVGGGLLLAAGQSEPVDQGQLAPVIDPSPAGPAAWSSSADVLGVVLLVTVAALALVRYWPGLILAGGLLVLPRFGLDTVFLDPHVPAAWWILAQFTDAVSGPLVVIGMLGAAQAVFLDGRTGWGAALAATALGAQLVGAALLGQGWLPVFNQPRPPAMIYWHLGLIVAAGVLLAPALLLGRARRPTAGPPPVRDRVWFVVVGVVAVGVQALAALLSDPALERDLSMLSRGLPRELYLATVLGSVVLVVAALAVAVPGGWAAAAGLTAALLQVAVAAPMILLLWASPLVPSAMTWGPALIGVLLGALAAASRWRVPLAAGASALCAAVLYLAYGATGGVVEKLISEPQPVPSALLLGGLCAAATAGVGSVAVTLGRRGALPAALGPAAATLVVGGHLVLDEVSNGDYRPPETGHVEPVYHVTASATMLLVVAAAIGGLHGAEVLAVRRAERRAAEEIRRQAATAERERLARPIHDGVLQVLAMVQREGPALGERGAELAELARVQGAALRGLIAADAADATAPAGAGRLDLRVLLEELAAPPTELALPADPVWLPADQARELAAAVAAALHNVARHAGPDAGAWVLVEDGPDEVLVSVRDDGVGIPEGRLAEAAADGRLGVTQSMVGRLADLGGRTGITSRPGEGTEVEFQLPRG